MNCFLSELMFGNMELQIYYVVVNVDLEQTVETIQEIISAERMKRVRQTGLKEFTQILVNEAKNG